MRAHEDGWAHAEGARGPAWLQVPEDPNALVTHLWSTSAAKNDNGALVVGGVDMRDLVADHGSPAYVLDEDRSEEHTSELQSLMRISYAVFCLKKKIP